MLRILFVIMMLCNAGFIGAAGQDPIKIEVWHGKSNHLKQGDGVFDVLRNITYRSIITVAPGLTVGQLIKMCGVDGDKYKIYPTTLVKPKVVSTQAIKKLELEYYGHDFTQKAIDDACLLQDGQVIGMYTEHELELVAEHMIQHCDSSENLIFAHDYLASRKQQKALAVASSSNSSSSSAAAAAAAASAASSSSSLSAAAKVVVAANASANQLIDGGSLTSSSSSSAAAAAAPAKK